MSSSSAVFVFFVVGMFKWWYDLSDATKAAVIGGPLLVICIQRTLRQDGSRNGGTFMFSLIRDYFGCLILEVLFLMSALKTG